MASYTWGSSPKINFTVTDTVKREQSGTSDNYSGTITITLGAMSGTSYFGYNIYCSLNGGTAKLLKDNSPSTWSSGAYSVSFSVSGSTSVSTVSFRITLSSTTASRGAETFTYNVSIGAKLPTPPPSVSSGWYSVARDNSGTVASGISEWVCGFSKAKVTFDPSKVTASTGATISKYTITYGGKEITASDNTATTSVILDTKTTIRIKVTDSRGYSTWEDYSITTLPYYKPTLTDVSIYRSDSQKAASNDGYYLTAKGTPGYTSLNGKNAITFTAVYKQSGAASFGTAVNLDSNTLTIINSTEISDTASYIVRLTVTDSLGYKAFYDQIISTKAVAFHLKSGGNGAAFGKFAEQDNLFDVIWPANFSNNVDVNGTLGVNDWIMGYTGVYAGSDYLRITGDVSHAFTNPPTGWVAGKDYGRAIIIGRDTDSDRYYIVITSTGTLWLGCALNGSTTITWYEK